MNKINEIESERLVSVVGEIATQLQQLAYLPLGKHTETLADRLGRSSAAAGFLSETLPSLRNQAAAEGSFMSAGQHKVPRQEAARSTEAQGIREATRGTVRMLRQSEASSAGAAAAAASAAGSSAGAHSTPQKPSGGIPHTPGTPAELNTAHLPVSPFAQTVEGGGPPGGDAPSTSLIAVLQRGKLSPSTAASALAAVAAQLQVVLRSRLRVSAEQDRQRAAKLRSFQERLKEEGAQLSTLKANLRAQRAEREAENNKADDQISKLTAEIETLEKRRDKETTSLADFVESHSAQQSSAHGDVMGHLDKQLQEQMAEHTATVRQSLEAERGVRRKRDAERTDLITRILAEYDARMLQYQQQIDAVEKLRSDLGARLTVLREHFTHVHEDSAALEGEEARRQEAEMEQQREYVLKYGRAVAVIGRARWRQLEARREAAAKKKKRKKGRKKKGRK